ncbi:PSD1 and planctomycete cytochrome C domain-containing protein [Neorhodopirellula pilleata]|uniref:PSD1 and planctomycete cytochrome C domain-containing protein n=1 Tax=Neorhodopirellula pilleata TaxID=2714738 RepID=UPI001E4DEA79|nr:PSD1 and planctomycete cytochrome C domain-containing protein [Neorhodopirellula pilleata]
MITFLITLALASVDCVTGTSDDAINFDQDIAPILQRHCIECHGEEEQNGGLRLDHREGAFGETDSGEQAIKAGDPGSSELLIRVSSTSEADRMPPEGPPLTFEQIDRLAKWISEGASWTDKADDPSHSSEETHHWSFRALTDVRPPSVQDESWPLGGLDRFIQAKREAAGLEVAVDADATTLIRRATYSLTGLPPTAEEVRKFCELADSPLGKQRAFSRLVDQLLSRPSYGERWGRHWMDWVRYADTAGDNSDYPIPQAYRYRNYVIESFNSDVPYDRLIVEQIAGDLLPASTQEQRNRQTIATGYLAMSRRFGSLIERYPWHLTIEDTIDNLGRTMLGLTVSCARCHDHKFDPITTRDYYGLYGFFASTQYPLPGLELFQAQHHFVPLVPPEQVQDVVGPHQPKTQKLANELERLLQECQHKSIKNAVLQRETSLDQQRQMRDELDRMLLKARQAGERLADHLKQIPAMETAYAVQEGEPTDANIQIKGEPDRPGATVTRRFPAVLGGQELTGQQATMGSGRLQLAQWIASPKNPLTARVIVNRVWQRHFGEGLVPTTSDFGLRGSPPTHPDLLDWLARDFIENGWSIKHLHRTIMSSRTYQLASQDLDANLPADPENHLYWKFNRQRLDAESIRDSLLSIGGSLDLAPLNEPHPFPDPKAWKFTQHHPFKDNYDSDKRSVYLMRKRLTADSYFQTFDGPDPNVCTSDRDASITALQALYFVNDEFVHMQADRFTSKLLEQVGSDSERIEYATLTILGREPSLDEVELISRHLASVEQQLGGVSNTANRSGGVSHSAWTSLVRSLLRLNEFLYVD